MKSKPSLSHIAWALFILVGLMLSCKKDEPLSVKTLKLVEENVEASTTGAVFSGTYDYTTNLKGITLFLSDKADMTGAMMYEVSLNGKNFSCTVNKLDSATKYYYRYRFDNGVNTLDWEIKSFTTEEEASEQNPPIVNTTSATNIQQTAATVGGNVTDDGGATVTSRGVKWGASSDNLNQTANAAAGGTGEFSVELSGLTSGQTIYYKAFATNSVGTSYGEMLNFTTGNVNLPTVTTSDVSNIQPTSATCGGNVTSDGGATVTARGVCWSTNQNPTISGTHTTDGSGSGSFSSSITDLTSGITYYVRAYATNSAGTAYGEQKTFTTNTLKPTVTTNSATNIQQTAATVGGNVTSDGGATVTARGVKWGTSQSNMNQTANASNGGTGNFTVNLSGLSAGQTYYYMAFATNSNGTEYGEVLNFVTGNVNLPTVTTASVSNIQQTTATCGGNVSNDGGGTVTTRGICWSTSANPTISNSHVASGSGTGSFNATMTGLTPNTTYHVRAYATNSAGTSYGTDRSFTTTANGEWLYYDNNQYGGSIGMQDGGSFNWAIMFPSSSLQAYAGTSLTKVAMFDDQEAHNGTIMIYQGGTTAPGSLIHQQAYSCTGSHNFVEFTLSSAITINTSQNLWIVFSNNTGQYVASYSETPNSNNPNGRWISLDGTDWYDILDVNNEFDYTWMIRGFVSNSAKGGEFIPLEMPKANHAATHINAEKKNELKHKIITNK